MINTKWLKEFRDSGSFDEREFYISYLVNLRTICQNSKINFNLNELNKLIEKYEL